MKRNVKNVTHSVHQRLLNLARQSNRRFNDLVQFYALERWLYRLAQSQYRERFVLKGALMLLMWRAPVTRPTRDIDLLGRTSNDLDSIRRVVGAICGVTVEDDGLTFDPDTVQTMRIAEDADYQGARAKFSGRLGTTRLTMQVDIGFSDIVTPAPVKIEYPTILDQPQARLYAYNRETAVAEKLEAMIQLGLLNTRMKDFFDVWLLCRSFDFEGRTLADAVRRTFERRRTELEPDPICMTPDFGADASKDVQYKAFLRRSLLSAAPPEISRLVAEVRAFAGPVLSALTQNQEFLMSWPAGGPWRPTVTRSQ